MPLWNIIDERWDRQLHSPLYVVGYFFNPAYFYEKILRPDLMRMGRSVEGLCHAFKGVSLIKTVKFVSFPN